ncbi:hypothetical protein C4587_01755, partial [Candidatus Parcubacteria bacterium]
ISMLIGMGFATGKFLCQSLQLAGKTFKKVPPGRLGALYPAANQQDAKKATGYSLHLFPSCYNPFFRVRLTFPIK